MVGYQNPRRAHRPLVITRHDWILLDGRDRDPFGLARFETLIREGKGVEAALELLDDERLTEHHARKRKPVNDKR